MVGTLVRVLDALRELPIGDVVGRFIGRLTGIGTIGGGAFGAVDVEVVVDVDDQFCTPWWPRQAPRREVPLHVVPSLQIALALPVVDTGALAACGIEAPPDMAAVEFLERDLREEEDGLEVVVPIVVVEEAADPLSFQLCTPRCPRHAPRCEVPVQVVPSLQTALALPDVDAANAGGAPISKPANAIAKNPIMVFITPSLDGGIGTLSFDDANATR